MKKITLFIAFIILVLSSKAQTFEPAVIIDPPHPQVGDTIRVGLFETWRFPCLILPMENLDGETHLLDFNNSLPDFPENHIDLIVVTMLIPICTPFPVTPAPRKYYELGVLAAGDYSLRTGYVGRATSLPPATPPFQYGDILTFSVTQPQPKIIAATSTYGLILLSIFILTFALFFSKKQGQLNFRR